MLRGFIFLFKNPPPRTGLWYYLREPRDGVIHVCTATGRKEVVSLATTSMFWLPSAKLEYIEISALGASLSEGNEWFSYSTSLQLGRDILWVWCIWMEKKQPAGCQKSSVCLCKKQVSFLEPRGKERHKQRRLAYLTQQLAKDSILSCLHLHLSSVFPNTLISIDESPKKNLYTLCLPAMERGWKENRGLQIRSAQILVNR